MKCPTTTNIRPLPPAVGLFLGLLPTLAASGCGEAVPAPADGGFSSGDAFVSEPDATSDPDAGGPRACLPAEAIPCVDQQIAALDLFDTVSPSTITEEGTTPGEFSTWILATGGGLTPTESFVYGRFTDEGLVKVEVSDEDAFASTDWDISFRRFLIRLNGGVSGPSCVTAARTAPGTTFEDVTTVPEGLSYRVEEYFTTSCDLVPDGSGLGSPATALSSYWTYPGCVAMTDNVYVIELASGRHVRFQVLSYYTPANQESCDTSGSITTPSGAGNVRVRWAFVD